MRWRKVVRDLWLQRGRAALVVLAMALGVFGIVWISSSAAVLSRELRAEYLASNPASATITATGLTPELAAEVRTLPGVAAAETAATFTARIRTGPGDYTTAKLFSRTDFSLNSIAKLTPEEGAWPPPPGEIVIERAAMRVAKTTVGGTVELDIPGSRPRTLRVAGVVHDIGQAPAWQDRMVYGYVTPATLAELGYSPEPTELRILVAEHRLDRGHITTVAEAVADRLRTRGVTVTQVWMRPPGVHPHQSQMDSLLWLQQSMGVLALVLSGLLVATLMSALLAGQVRQIGAMKAIGGRTGQIAAGYAWMVMILCLIAFAIGWPLGWLGAKAYITFVSGILNIDVHDTHLPVWVIATQFAVGLAVPLLAAAVPVLRATRATPAEAMRDHGVSTPGKIRDRDRRSFLPRLPRLFTMAGRNTFRRRARTALTMTALSLGGATFIAALNLGTSLNGTMDGQADALRYDVAANLDRPYPREKVGEAARGVPGVALAETWLRTPVTVGDGPAAPLAPTLYGVPIDTPMLRLPVLSGRWLTPRDTNAIVISHNLAEEFPMLKVGGDARLRVNGKFTTWHVVGVVRQVAAPPAAWTAYDQLAGATGSAGMSNAVRVLASDHNPATLTAVRQGLDRALTGVGIDLLANDNTVEAQQGLRDHILVIVAFLGLMTLLSILIGGLGLATTMAVNVIERTREIGVLRAVGATTATVLALVAIEGGVVGGLSWLAALVLSAPASLVFGQIMGEIMIETPLDFMINGWAPFAWLAVVVTLAGLASVAPARRAAGLTVRDTLAYQ
jgi:putative ABC transport system permease protein